ncbi:MAG: DevR family CRISPR-associated autoregulator [Candidatus Jordarchaeales archaeon]|nr:DevR family CRISPR-associated autoregulator [Candidatus Jordarchaeia archaeon]
MYVGVAVKVLLNMHDLNNERAEEIRRVPVIYRGKDGGWTVFEEAVAVSGLMIKRWHFANMVELGGEVCFCDLCKNLEAIRIPSEKSGKARSEFEIIKDCAGEDVHGFLRANPVLRRESMVKFSWMLPLFNDEVVEAFGLPTPFRVVQHTRNIREITENAAKRMNVDLDELRRWQMPYPRSYAAGVYGFVSLLDLKHIGYSFTDKKEINEKERRERRKVALQAYIPLVTGSCGASLARALPVADVLEVVTVLSDKVIPAPIHPIYSEYVEENARLYHSVSKAMRSNVTMYVWSKEKRYSEGKSDSFELKMVEKAADGFSEIIGLLERVGEV